MNASLPEGLHQYLWNWKTHCTPRAMDSNLRNYNTCLLSQLHGFLHQPTTKHLMKKLYTCNKGGDEFLLGFHGTL